MNKPKDYLGRELEVGDLVVFTALNYRNFTKGILLTNTAPTGGSIMTICGWSDKYKKKVRQSYGQMIKVEDPDLKDELTKKLEALEEI